MKTRPPSRMRPAFTLIELLVVMAILAVVLTLTATISGQAIDLRSATKARIVSERAAAAFMNQFEADLSQRIERSEARTNFGKQAGNDEISLLTQRPGFALQGAAADRRAALVSYRVRHQMLERAASGYGYGSPAARPHETAGTLALARVPVDGPPPPPDRAYQSIAPGLIRLELSFLVRDGASQVVRGEPPADQELIEAVVATVVTLDPDRSRMVDEAGFRMIAAEFRDAKDNELPGEEWTATAARLSSKLPNLPKTALQQVRVHQRLVPWTQRKMLP